MAKTACRYCGFEAARQDDTDCPAIQHKYTPMYRPPGFATVPAGWVLVERPRMPSGFERRTDLPLSEHKFGVIGYTQPLSDKDIKDFQLQVL